MGSYINQVYCEQGAVVSTGAASFASTVHVSPGQPGDVRCGVCVLAEIQRIVDGKMDSRRDRKFTEVKLLPCRAKWTCELLLNPAPTSGENPFAVARRRAAGAVTEFDAADLDDARPLGADKRPRGAARIPPRGT